MKEVALTGSLDDLARRGFEEGRKPEPGFWKWLFNLSLFYGLICLIALVASPQATGFWTLALAGGALALSSAFRLGWRFRRRLQLSRHLNAFRRGDAEAIQTVHRFAVKQFRAAIKSHRARTLGRDTEWGRARESLHGALDEAGGSVAYWKARARQSPDNKLSRAQVEVATELQAKLRLAVRKLDRRTEVLLNFYNECEARLTVMDRRGRDMEEARKLEDLSGRADVAIAGAEGVVAAIGREFVREAKAVGRALGGLAEVQITSLAGEAPLDNIEYLADRVIENSESEERAIEALEDGWRRVPEAAS